MLKMHVVCKFFVFFLCFSHVLPIFGPFLGKTLQKGSNIDQKSAKTMQKTSILCLLGRCTDFPDWFPTGSRFPKSGVGICRKRCQVLARNLPNWMSVLVGLGRVGASLGVFGGCFRVAGAGVWGFWESFW